MVKLNQPSISGLNSWDNHVEKVIDVIIEALSMFYSQDGIDKLKEEFSIENDEREIEIIVNTVLYFFLCKANRCLQQKRRNGKRRGLSTFPEFDSQHKPNPNDRSISSIKRQQKRPDFIWGYADFSKSTNPNDKYKGNREFVIECKRLGSPPSKSNYLNKKYANEGIKRFIDNNHRYGENESASAMVGYIEDMEFTEILQEVNQTIESKLGIDKLTKQSENWQEKSTTQLKHSFERDFEKSPFTLHHLWLDLKGCYPRKTKI